MTNLKKALKLLEFDFHNISDNPNIWINEKLYTPKEIINKLDLSVEVVSIRPYFYRYDFEGMSITTK